MKKMIKIAHLYYDLMNLYGENGNIQALVRFIKRQNVEVSVDKFSLDDKIDFKKYDIYYLGAGADDNSLLVLSNLFIYKNEIKEAIEEGKMFLATGNAMELFGQKICIKNARNKECLGLFDYNASRTDERIVTEIFYKFDELEENLGRDFVGFKNVSANIVNNNAERLFEFQDSIHYKNFYAMQITGPVLVRNPYFTDYLLESLFEDLGLEYKSNTDAIEYIAYHEYVKNFVTNANLD